jgi:hypothetical protein
VSEKHGSEPVHTSAPQIVHLLVTLTRLMLRGSGENTFRISSTVQEVAESYGVSADVQASPDSAVVIVLTDEVNQSCHPRGARHTTHRPSGRPARVGARDRPRPSPMGRPCSGLNALAPPRLCIRHGRYCLVRPLRTRLSVECAGDLPGSDPGAPARRACGRVALLRRAQPKVAPAVPLLAAAAVSTVVLALYPIIPLKGKPGS